MLCMCFYVHLYPVWTFELVDPFPGNVVCFMFSTVVNRNTVKVQFCKIGAAVLVHTFVFRSMITDCGKICNFC